MSFLQSAFKELYDTDGLLVMAKGLGLRTLLCKFIMVHCRSTDHLVLVLNAREEHSLICEILRADGVATDQLPQCLSGKMALASRQALYNRGGCHIITNEILGRDLSQGYLKPVQVSGVLIYAAHTVKENSWVDWVLGMLLKGAAKVRNAPKPFIKAFSDSPEQLAAGLDQLAKTLTALHVRQVYLWPRIHIEVAQQLDRGGGVPVDEFAVPVTPTMRRIQAAIVESMDKDCLHPLKTCRALDLSEVRMDDPLGDHLDQRLAWQLSAAPDVSQDARQKVSDLATLRMLLEHLLRYDCVTFLEYLQTLRDTNNPSCPSQWLLEETAGPAIFNAATARLYSVVDATVTVPPNCVAIVDNVGGTRAGLVLQLEAPPKWRVLASVVAECQKLWQNMVAAAGGAPLPYLCDEFGGAAILVVARDARICWQLQEFLREGERPWLLRMFQRHVIKHYAQTESLRNRLAAAGPAAQFGRVEDRLLWAYAEELMARGATVTAPVPDANAAKTATPPRKRLRKHSPDDVGDDPYRIVLPPSQDVAGTPPASIAAGAAAPAPPVSTSSAGTTTSSTTTTSAAVVSILPRLQVVYFPLTMLDRRYSILQDLRPNFVISYDPDLTFARELELYAASSAPMPVKLYSLAYQPSGESQQYIARVERERNSFRKLMEEKRNLVLPEFAGHLEGTITAPIAPAWGSTIADARFPQRSSGGLSGPISGRIIVDAREWHSQLPALLGKAGFNLTFPTLEVGDYVLSPTIVVERKALSDLVESLNNGRLYGQAQAMARYYRLCILLIEFSENRPFRLIRDAELTTDINPRSVLTKLALLLIHNPTLRVMWARTPHTTVQLFRALKNHKPEPDEAQAVAVGKEAEDGSELVVATGPRTQVDNEPALELLMKLPGITRGNYRHVLDRCTCVADLFDLEEVALAGMIGTANAHKLYTFLHKRWTMPQAPTRK